MDHSKEIGTRLKDLRTEKGKSDQEVSNGLKRLGYDISRELINKLETGSRNLTLQTLTALSEYYSVSSDYILGKTTVKKPEKNIQITSMTLNISETATNNLINLSFIHGGLASEIFSDMIESADLVNVMKVLKDSKDGISSQAHDSRASDPDRLKQIHIDMADMYIMKSTRKVENFLRDILGYNDFVKGIEGDGINDTDDN